MQLGLQYKGSVPSQNEISKFMSALVPKMDLAPLVLKRALPDLVFFGLVFFISMGAFAAMFYVQVPP